MISHVRSAEAIWWRKGKRLSAPIPSAEMLFRKVKSKDIHAKNKGVSFLTSFSFVFFAPIYLNLQVNLEKSLLFR